MQQSIDIDFKSQIPDQQYNQQYDQSNNLINFSSLFYNYIQTHYSTLAQKIHLSKLLQNSNEIKPSKELLQNFFNLVSRQTKNLENLSQKVDDVVRRNQELHRKIKEYEIENRRLKDMRNLSIQADNKCKIHRVKIDGESINKEQLLKILFGEQKYQYQLQLAENLEQPLYRERNFNIHMQLLNMNNQRVKNSNKIQMNLALYTCENPPKLIQKNTSGQKMLKGLIDQSLTCGLSKFDKIQIREVTSHYRGGWIFLVAIPCVTPSGVNKNTNFIDYTKIKPLVMDRIVVKAKKPKKKCSKLGQTILEGG